METILLRGSRMEPRLAVLKPISSAVSIGTGGPFGAEGPIIVTGGAIGSIVGQLLHLTAAERRCLLVAGAAAGMTAVFGTPVAAVLLAVELLLFEWRPRSMIPVALGGVLCRGGPRGARARRAADERRRSSRWRRTRRSRESVMAGAVLVGAACGGLAWVMTRCVYGAEDLFGLLPLHWSWWPAIGGVVVGVGGHGRSARARCRVRDDRRRARGQPGRRLALRAAARASWPSGRSRWDPTPAAASSRRC